MVDLCRLTRAGTLVNARAAGWNAGLGVFTGCKPSLAVDRGRGEGRGRDREGIWVEEEEGEDVSDG